MRRMDGVSPYVDIRIFVGGIGWNYGVCLITKKRQKQLKPSRVDNSGVPGLYPAKAGTTRFRPMAGLVGCVFYLILVFPVFVPERRRYLFLAAALLLTLNIVSYSYSNPAEYVLLFTSKIIILVQQQLWIAGEGPTIEWSYLRRRTVREKRLSFRGHGDCIIL